MKKFCSNCGGLIESARLNATKDKATTCISCMRGNDVGRVAGFQIVTSKTTYTELEITSQERAKSLYDQQNRIGGIVSKGARMKGH